MTKPTFTPGSSAPFPQLLKYLHSRIILKEQFPFSLPPWSVALYVTSYEPGMVKYEPGCLLESTDGSAPELSATTGASQFTLTLFPVPFFQTISAGQDTKRGASVSKITIKRNSKISESKVKY